MATSRITMNWARQTTKSKIGMHPSVLYRYGGTREDVILVSKAPPKSSANGARAGNGARRRDELADFLRQRRASLQPQDVGLAGGGRRRTPGLRREEVAQLARVGTTWYTWLEQGRDVRASQQVLPALADALQMNAAVSAVFCDPTKYPEGRRNQLWSIFMDPVRRARSTDWENSARNALARFRADNARHLGDPDFEELIDDLREGSEEFRCWWKRHEVARSGTGRKALRHPELGKLWFEHSVFKLEES